MHPGDFVDPYSNYPKGQGGASKIGSFWLGGSDE
jgi:hypothetical protein